MSNIMCVNIINSCVLMFSVAFLLLVYSSRGEASPKPQRSGDFAYPDEVNFKQFHNHQHHENFQHSPEFHRLHPEFHHNPEFHRSHHHFDYDDDFVDSSAENLKPLVEEKTDNKTTRNYQNSTLQIPLEFVQNLNKYTVNDLLIKYVEGEDKDVSPIQSRFGDDGEERSAAIMPKQAACMPELTTIKIASSDDPSILYIPQCTRVERCGGCCTHSLLSCQPQETEQLSFKVIKTQYTGGKKLQFIGKEIIQVERHTKCKCDCKIKAEHCNKLFQEYKKSECRCVCRNLDEEKKCYKNSLKLWNPDSCICECRETMQCSTGTYFDSNECRCKTTSMKRRFVEVADERKTFRREDLRVRPLFDYGRD